MTTLLDRYLTSETWKRLAVALAVVLASLVIERLLRLFDLVTKKGGPFSTVWEMALMLIPHYLGLALPAGFFISIYLVAARFGEDNEFDALMSSGVSPLRFAMPFVATAVALVTLSIGLFGYAQPYSRYAYRAILHQVNSIPWGATVPEWSFATVDKDATVTADRVGEGRGLEGVFIHMVQDGREIALTARAGQLVIEAGQTYYRLKLFDGVQMVTDRDGTPSATHFDEFLVQRDFSSMLALFRSRGNDVRELSLSELAGDGAAPNGKWTRAEATAELHGRLVRAVSLVWLPFLSIPLALTAKRGRRGTGIVVGGIALVMYHYVLQTVEGLAELGRMPALTLWGAMVLFAALALTLFWRAQRHPGESPLDPLVTMVDHAVAALPRWRKAARP